MGFSRQEYWSGLQFPSPGDLPDPGIEPWSLALQVYSLPSEQSGKPPCDHNTLDIFLLVSLFITNKLRIFVPFFTLHSVSFLWIEHRYYSSRESPWSEQGLVHSEYLLDAWIHQWMNQWISRASPFCTLNINGPEFGLQVVLYLRINNFSLWKSWIIRPPRSFLQLLNVLFAEFFVSTKRNNCTITVVQFCPLIVFCLFIGVEWLYNAVLVSAV